MTTSYVLMIKDHNGNSTQWEFEEEGQNVDIYTTLQNEVPLTATCARKSALLSLVFDDTVFLYISLINNAIYIVKCLSSETLPKWIFSIYRQLEFPWDVVIDDRGDGFLYVSLITTMRPTFAECQSSETLPK